MNPSARNMNCTGRGFCGGVLAALGALSIAPALAVDYISGQVLGGGAPIASSTVTLWAATANAPKQLGQAKTGADGRFALNVSGAAGTDATLYVVAKGGKSAADKAGADNPAIA